MQIQHHEFSFHLTVHPCDCRLPILGSWKLLPDLCVWSIIPFDFFWSWCQIKLLASLCCNFWIILLDNAPFRYRSGVFHAASLLIPLCSPVTWESTLGSKKRWRVHLLWGQHELGFAHWLLGCQWNQFDEWLRMGPIQKCYGTRLLWATDFDLRKPSEVGAP